ncbi:midasin [Saccharata proteae CBS 121410]|uniref:Midasin n=1 Tax=Saccharata proteae CBS 121410 TaxID=1314787 RepID=A0A9P4HVH8_9PEZI|nr:midasin [Saccharata proteae CBS 121410]
MQELPDELQKLLQQTSNRQFLQDLTTASLNPRLTDYVFTLFKPVFVEVRASWATHQPSKVLPAFARVLLFAPYLSDHAEILLSQKLETALDHVASTSEPNDDNLAIEFLLGLFRLLVFDNETFGKFIQPARLQTFLSHTSRPLRYLAVRVLCLYLHAADAALEEMVAKYMGEDAIMGEWEGKNIDYRFLSLWEERRQKDMSKALRIAQMEREACCVPQISRVITQADLGPHTAEIHGVLLPRSGSEKEATSDRYHLIPTRTTVVNLTAVAQKLTVSKPLLLSGVAGSGKSLIIRHLAQKLNKLDSMVTLHLNEQSDAKLLIGMYTTGTTPGTFTWRPGVLTTAVREGRWVMIEDLDRAPNEVISTLLPLVESGELLIPSRGETVRAARGFRILATVRTTLNLRGEEIIPGANMIGHRFWQRVPVQMPAESELGEIIAAAFPSIPNALVPQIMEVYGNLQFLFRDKSFVASKSGLLRSVTPRDLFKWCSRIEPRQLDDMFLEAVDCLAGSMEPGLAFDAVVGSIARDLHVDPQKRDYLLQQRPIDYRATGNDNSGNVAVGRATLRREQRKRRKERRPFATNEHTRRLLEKIAVAVEHSEPLLLVGETGTGKTTCIQHLANELGRKLEVFNLSQQSESGDLLGGFKPVNMRSLMVPMKDRFDELFLSTFSNEKNAVFLKQLGDHVAKGRWKTVCKFWQTALRMVEDAVRATNAGPPPAAVDSDQPQKKKRKVEQRTKLPSTFSQVEWDSFAVDLKALEQQVATKSSAFAFKFIEGNIVKAVRNGDWVLLDEINLASPDTLEALADLLSGGVSGTPSLLLTETGNVERIVAHPNFRVFAAMNPATDVGKKDLPMGIRSRFTELYVESPDRDLRSLQNIVETYLGQWIGTDSRLPNDVASLYLEIQRLNGENKLVDGADQKPHFSLRTLTRTLLFAQDVAPLHSLRRALFEGFCMSFLTFLDKASEDLVADMVIRYLKPELRNPLRKPADKNHEYVQIRRDDADRDAQWLRRGNFEVSEEEHYIITNFVWRNLTNLVRAASTRRFPVLIQGPTSAGKTSMIEYLAKRSGNKFVRINNHEHTDLQEYLGTYISGSDGKLQFQEGVLVKALREGHWIVLDELNLAPTDVLEALNRLLDDNRELLIPETQETVQPHENFMLFATQNPAGLYGGRKALSRAFRNRFLELHFDDIPVSELKYILERRTELPRSWCEYIVNVYNELSALRQNDRLFEQKSFATLRDLFRWALRKPETSQQLAEHGYMLLAERVRKPEERQAVKKVIEKVVKLSKIDEDALYDPSNSVEVQLYERNVAKEDVVWTKAMLRLYVLVANALRNHEPVLLVGETGCGKTTVCQMLAEAFSKELFIVNAHQNTETGDLIGAQRPIRNRASTESQLVKDLVRVLEAAAVPSESTADKDVLELLKVYDELLKANAEAIPISEQQAVRAQRIKLASLFEWADGSLVRAMKSGQYFLLDEISLADDSVLERLNSVLEPSRSILLAEKGPTDSSIKAAEGFQFLATMNPGGDYGKKELSPALRNRFTEIWVPALSDLQDITQIVKAKLIPSAVQYTDAIVGFSQWFNEKYNTSAAASISIRDTLAWIQFINRCGAEDPVFGVVHGAAMVFIDTLGANPAALLAISPANLDSERGLCLQRLSELLHIDVGSLYSAPTTINYSDSTLAVGTFSVPRSANAIPDPSFTMTAPTTKSNAMRVLRALQLSKPILLEGNPGVGKTTLVTAIAKAVGIPLTRINLSEQTDLMDLFGSDVPVEGAQAGTFAWRDAPFLKAMKNGEWVLLDEMNLATQSVLEGLNACLDHRGEVYVSELDQTFHQHPGFRVFAAQNPHHQGGGRKGLPASFVNRFTVVYADIFRTDDLMLICKQSFPDVSDNEVETLIQFIAELDTQVQLRRFGALGSPWEFNLRDTLRWLKLLTGKSGLLPAGGMRDFLETIITQRFRSQADRRYALELFSCATKSPTSARDYYHNLDPENYQVGLGLLQRDKALRQCPQSHPVRISQLPIMESMMISVQQNWPVILVGPPASGKTSLIKQLAATVGASLVVSSMNADVDAMDLVGGYEQVDPSRQVLHFLQKLRLFARTSVIQSDFQRQSTFSLFHILHLCSAPVASVDFAAIYSALARVSEQIVSFDLDDLLGEAAVLKNGPATIDRAQFQWVDGLLVQALEQGKWLVLDNANLCSSSVLDRLNSLLEPNGYLSINEHSTSDGEAKVVRPHPNFRIFMTMDPRHGELSRAMRNRAIELFVFPSTSGDEETELSSFSLESSMYRFRNLAMLGDGQHENVSENELVTVSLDHLSFQDSRLLESYCQQVSTGLLDLQVEVLSHAFNTQIPFFSNLPDEWTRRAFSFWQDTTEQMKAGQQRYINAQPIHPLNNQSLVLYNERSSSAHWLAAMFDLCLNLRRMESTLVDAKEQAKQAKIKDRTRLGRSLVPARAKTNVAQDPVAGVGQFLAESALLYLNRVCDYWWNIFALTDTQRLDDAVFHVYLNMGNEIIESFVGSDDTPAASKNLENALSASLNRIQIDNQLKTGLSMEILWNRFKPQTPSTYKSLLTLLELERLADRFDASVWLFDVPLAELARVRMALANTIELVSSRGIDAEALTQELQAAIAGLESGVPEGREPRTPYFQAAYEGLCQYFDLSGISGSGDTATPLVSLLAVRPTRSALAIHSDAPDAWLSTLSRYLGGNADEGAIALSGGYDISLIKSIFGLENVTLDQMDLLRSELDILGQSLAGQTPILLTDQLDTLYHMHDKLLRNILFAHKDCVQEVLPGQPTPHEDLPADHYFRTALGLLEPCFVYTNQNITEKDQSLASKSWISLAIASLWLYVPDRPFDPALRPMIERDLFNAKKSSLEASLNALTLFGESFSGEKDNLRTRLLVRDIRAMGAEPPVPQIARPPTSELAQLTGEFANLRRVLETLERASASGDVEMLRDLTLQQNIAQIIKRLTEGHRAYDDITEPIVGFLQCLRIGLMLVPKSQGSAADEVFSYISEHTPFLGFTASEQLVPGARSLIPVRSGAVDLRWHALYALGVSASVAPERLPSLDERTIVHDLFFQFFEQWKERLQADQEEAAEKSGLYRYKGGIEEEEEATEEELLSMFPDFEQHPESGGPSDSSAVSPQELARKLADCHADIFTMKSNPSEKIKVLMEKSMGYLGRLNQSNEIVKEGRGLSITLPAIFVALRRESDLLLHERNTTGKGYNFYTDANLSEANKLIALIHRIQLRFRQIREVWPEHATLSDVLNVCDELLTFRHVEPVAKFLTKGEKLHAFMYEWQRVASKEFTAATLYDDITTLLISWRQLELTTWARLFDIEIEKCKDDAKSWFFVAYENTVAIAETLQLSTEAMGDHARALLRTLESFLYSTTAGQYSQRLRLLEQFREHLALREVDVPSVRPLRTALGNLIRYFTRFEGPVRDMIVKGRQSLEKQMKDVLRIAGWKDRNIDALRQSAKTSHRKLFKLVRKFRAVLNQPVESILRQDPSDGSASQATPSHVSYEPVDATVDPSVLELCQTQAPGWDSRPSRFKDTKSTVRLMAKMAKPRESTIFGPEYVDDFLVNLENSMAELAKATPSTLTAENKDQVKHLKSRKRKLFNDTLKELKEMGFRSHVGGDVLAKQDSLATVLSRIPTLPMIEHHATIRGAETYLHRSLNLMAQVRDIAHEHNGDLQNAEVLRCIGNFESMLHTAIKQRETAARALGDLQSLDKTVRQMAAFSTPGDEPMKHIATASSGSLMAMASWIGPVLEVCAYIVDAQAQLGKFDATEVIEGLRKQGGSFGKLAEEIQHLEEMPKGLVSKSYEDLAERSNASLQDLSSQLSAWMTAYPTLACVLSKVIPQGEAVSQLSVNGSATEGTVSFSDVSSKLFEALDSILGSFQDLEGALKLLPESTEDPAWFVAENGHLGASLQSLHVARVTESLRGILSQLHLLSSSDGASLATASAVFAAMLPIIQQYRSTIQTAVSMFGQMHESTCKMTYRLSKAFIQVGTRGFCTPQEKSDDKAGESEKLEGGTGLGEGEGAEDISKDIQDDEDLTELAQEQDKNEDRDEIEDEKDAVDMGNEDMEGEMGDEPEKEDDDEAGSEKDDENEDMDEEAGDVDDLGPSTVDEKMWDDGGADEDNKDKEGDEGKGTKDEEEQAAAGEQEDQKKDEKKDEQQDGQDGQQDEEMEAEAGADEEEHVGREELEQTDPHMQEGENLDLPDELNMDDNKSDKEDEDLSDMDDMDDPMDEDEGGQAEGEEEDADPEEGPQDLDNAPEEEVPDINEEDKQDQAAEPEAEPQEEVPEGELRTNDGPDDNAANDDAAETGAGLDAHDDPDNKEQADSSAQREEGAEGEASEQQQQDAGEKGAKSKASQQEASGRDEDAQDAANNEPFKKLGDVLEQWYDNQRQIQNASEQEENRAEQQNDDIDMADADFEHLPNEDAQADVQALGAAEEEQAKALDKNDSIPVNEQEQTEDLPPEIGQEPQQDEDVAMEDAEVEQKEQSERQDNTSGQPNAFVGEHNDQRQIDEMETAELSDDDEDSLEEVDRQLSEAHLSNPDEYPRSMTEARALWQHHEASTRTLSQSLTEQLRLILAPTLATKMRGGHRTGKRLNMKAIIPYIASQYKRDKIWLRRSAPSKRAYQIMLALDDSKSMASGGASTLAFETLALVSKALSTLEAGSLSIMRFGADVQVAHPFSTPFTSDAGVDVFRQFGFQQEKTDVQALVKNSIELLREARLQATGNTAELWQLAVVISDGVCGDHGEVARLVRRAQEERIMIVFVVVDAAGQQGTGGGKGEGKDSEQGVGAGGSGSSSIMDLLDVRFEDGKLIKRRYMDTFPFRWFVVVRDVRELPGVLSTALRQWFAEVVDTAG